MYIRIYLYIRMFIDYIYLMLTIILICFIIFLIYLSYEYRKLDEPSEPRESSEISKPTKCLEHFFNPSPTPTPTSRFKTKTTLPPLATIPRITLPPPKKMDKLNFDLYAYNNITNKFDQSYININSEIKNRQVTADNIKNIKVFDKITKNYVNSQKLLKLKNSVEKLQIPEKFPINKLIKTIKSKYNSQYISTMGFDKSKYAIMANDKCLTVSGLCKEPYCLLDCQTSLYSSDSQKFKTERIQNEIDAAKSMGTTLGRISNANVYPFNVFKSLVNNNCLTLSKDGITVEPCNLNNIKQQWEISPTENICVLK